MSSIPGLGKAKYGNGGTFAKNFRLQTPKNKDETTNNIYRIFPPIKSQAETGKWAMYWGIHFGYRGKDRQDPSKTKIRTFKCVEDKDFRTQMIRKECAECNLIAANKRLKEERTAQMKASGQTKEDIDTLLGPLDTWLRDHNVDRKWYINVVNDQGEFGTLAISHKAKKQLDAKLGELTQMGIDGIDPEQGVWFNFKRTGKGIEVQDTVEVVMDRQGLQMTLKLAPLSEEQCRQGLAMLPDLLDVVTVISSEQIGMLVTGSGDPDEVDAVFNQSATRESSPAIRTSSVGVQGRNVAIQAATTVAATNAVVATEQAKPAAVTTSVVTQAVEAPESVVEENGDDEEAALQRQLEALRAAKLAKATPVTTAKPAAPTPPPAATVADLNDQDFLKMFPPPAR